MQTRYLYGGSKSYKLVSNPYREATSSAASSACNNNYPQCTMGWTLTSYDQDGRPVSEQFFNGSGLPAPWGGNGNTSGAVSTVYNAQYTTVTDEVGKARQNQVDGLGRLIGVVEDPGSSPHLNYQTVYGYDALDDLVSVNQSGQTRSFSFDSLKRLSSATNPESGTVSYKYDSDGNLLTKTDARNVITCFGLLSGTSCATGYDALSRLTQKSYSDGTPAVTYSYDPNVQFGKGRLGSISNSNATTNYTSFDAFGNVLASNQLITGQTYPFAYTYNLAGSLTSETYPSGRAVTTGYDGANRSNAVSGLLNAQATTYASSFTFAPDGAPTQYAYGNVGPNQNNLWRQISYNSRLQMVGYIDLINNDPKSELLNVTLDWNGASNNGNLHVATYNNGGPGYPQFATFQQTYGYDAANRINSVTDTGGWSRTLCSDAYGNTWVIANSGVPLAGNTPQMLGSTCSTSSTPYTANNQTNGGSYDLAGNQTVVNGNTLTYDAENRQVSETDGVTHAVETYSYDGDGRRVSKTGPSGTIVYVYDVLSQLAAEYSTSNSSFPCATCYLSADHLGSTRLVTDSNASVIARHDYLPFGEEIPANTGGRDLHWGPGNDTVTQKFTGKERDSETGLDFFGARFYGSALGRFTSPDPSRLSAFISDPQSWNMYSYAYNNPLQFVDRNGRWPTKIHNQIIDAAFPNLTQGQRQILKDVSAHQDAFLTGGTVMGGQAAALSFQHAMRAPGQTVTEAQQEYDDFVSMNEDQATRTQIDFWAAGNPGLSNDALAQFAAALHAVLDSTSPAHSGFQVWEWWHFREHGKREATITPQQLNTAVTAARNAFNTTFQPNFNEFDLLHLIFQAPQQTEVKSKICYDTGDGKKVCQ